MPTSPVLVQVSVDYFPRGPKIVRATDNPADDKKYRTKGQASAELLREVMTKVIDNRENGTDITLMLDADGFIVPDPGFSPVASAHLEAARVALTALESAVA